MDEESGRKPIGLRGGKWAGFFVAAFLLLAALGVILLIEGTKNEKPPSADAAVPADDWYDPALRWYYQQLTEREKKLFNAARQAAMSYKPVTYPVSGGYYSQNEVDRVRTAIQLDCPELIQMEAFSVRQQKSSRSLEVTVENENPIFEKEDALAYCSRLRQAIQEIQASFPADVHDYEKELAIYLYLIGHCDFLVDVPRSITASAAICDGSAHCEGYANGLCLLLRCCGIPCVAVWSDDHVWNCVQLDGEWYACDATWDDRIVSSMPSIPEGQPINLPLLNMPNRIMLSVPLHQISEDLTRWFELPDCTAIQWNYYCQTGIYIAPGTVNAFGEIARQFRERYRSGQTCIPVWADGDAEWAALEEWMEWMNDVLDVSSIRFYKSPDMHICYFLIEG